MNLNIKFLKKNYILTFIKNTNVEWSVSINDLNELYRMEEWQNIINNEIEICIEYPLVNIAYFKFPILKNKNITKINKSLVESHYKGFLLYRVYYLKNKNIKYALSALIERNLYEFIEQNFRKYKFVLFPQDIISKLVKKYNSIVFLSRNYLFMYIDKELVYFRFSEINNIKYLEMMILRTLYAKLFKGKLYFINLNNDFNAFENLINVLKENVEKEVMLIEICHK